MDRTREEAGMPEAESNRMIPLVVFGLGLAFDYGFGAGPILALGSAPATAALLHTSMIAMTRPVCLLAPDPRGQIHTPYIRVR